MSSPSRVGVLVARLHDTRGGDLLNYLRQRVRNDVAARDIAQEAYLRFIRLGDPARIRNPEAYLFRIAANVLSEHALRAQGAAASVRSEEVATAALTPFEIVASTQVGVRLSAALDELPPMQRAALILHLRDGLTCDQIARQAGISASMVKKHLRNAVMACREHLKELKEHQ
jgi:RNA polymerase sigma factor (sigma-70 family)